MKDQEAISTLSALSAHFPWRAFRQRWATSMAIFALYRPSETATRERRRSANAKDVLFCLFCLEVACFMPAYGTQGSPSSLWAERSDGNEHTERQRHCVTLAVTHWGMRRGCVYGTLCPTVRGHHGKAWRLKTQKHLWAARAWVHARSPLRHILRLIFAFNQCCSHEEHPS